jgi:uncharacterized protein with PIN domain
MRQCVTRVTAIDRQFDFAQRVATNSLLYFFEASHLCHRPKAACVAAGGETKKICEEAVMTIETVNTAATERPRQFARCAQCGSTLVVPEWSERLGERCVRYLWSCDACGYGFETSVYFPKE